MQNKQALRLKLAADGSFTDPIDVVFDNGAICACGSVMILRHESSPSRGGCVLCPRKFDQLMRIKCVHGWYLEKLTDDDRVVCEPVYLF